MVYGHGCSRAIWSLFQLRESPEGFDRRCPGLTTVGARRQTLEVSGLQHRGIGRGGLCFPSLDPSNERDRCRCGPRGLIALGSLIKKRNRRSAAVRYVRFIVVSDLAQAKFFLLEKSQPGFATDSRMYPCDHASRRTLVARRTSHASRTTKNSDRRRPSVYLRLRGTRPFHEFSAKFVRQDGHKAPANV